MCGVRSAGRESSDWRRYRAPRIQPEPKEELLFIRNSEKFAGDRFGKDRLLKLIERDSTDVSFIAGGIRYLEHLAAPAGHEFSRDGEEAKALEGIVDSMAVAAAPYDSVQGEKRIVFAQGVRTTRP